MAATALVVPVPVLEPVVLPRLRRSLPDYLFSDADAVHAHITLLGPFADPSPSVLSDLTGFFAQVAPFAFALDGMYTFQDTWVSLRPDPEEPFRDLTHRLWRRFPRFPPHGGRGERIQPHLTLEYRLDQTTLASIRAEIAAMLPVHARAESASLFEYEPGASRVAASFPFRA